MTSTPCAMPALHVCQADDPTAPEPGVDFVASTHCTLFEVAISVVSRPTLRQYVRALARFDDVHTMLFPPECHQSPDLTAFCTMDKCYGRTHQMGTSPELFFTLCCRRHKRWLQGGKKQYQYVSLQGSRTAWLHIAVQTLPFDMCYKTPWTSAYSSDSCMAQSFPAFLTRQYIAATPSTNATS